MNMEVMKMRKRYITPQTDVVEMKTDRNLLAGSVIGNNVLDGDATNGDIGLTREETDLLLGDQGGLIEQLLH